jgi:hypothetical protein
VAGSAADVTGKRPGNARTGLTLVRSPALVGGSVAVRCTAPDALSNLVAVLELAADGQLRCSAARRPLAVTVRLVEDALVAGDYYGCDDPEGCEPIAAFAWPVLLQVGGLARLAGARLDLTPRGEAALARPSYPVLGALWERWLKSVSHDELSRVEAIRGQRRPATLTPATRRRAAVADGLAAVRPGEWIDVGTMFGILRTQPAPLAAARSLMGLWRLYLVDSCRGSLGHAVGKTWELVEGRYALCVLFEYAATLGIIDVAYTGPRGARDDYRGLWGADCYDCLSRYDGLVAVRVNELGAALLHAPGALPVLGPPVPRRDPR